MRYLLIIYSLITLLPLVAAPQGNSAGKCPVVKIQAERLPDLNVPRSGHSLVLVNGEPTVIGGHTTNFVPIASIEYYTDGEWHEVPSAFTHDDGFAVQLSGGKVLIGGGHERNLGIGQSFEVELYDPVSHTSEGFGSLDTKRALANAMALDGNRALVAGNWYHEDAIEMYDGKGGFMPVKGVSCSRAVPFILRTAKDDAIIFTAVDSKGAHTPHPVIERLHGEPYSEPLLQEWGLPQSCNRQPASAFIGDESKGDYSYLMMVENDQGQAAIARISNGEFSLLPTDFPVPMACQWGKIVYRAQIYADRQSQRAYLLGIDPEKYHAQTKLEAARVYILTIDYATTPARLTLGYTDKISDVDIECGLLTTDGDLMIGGGIPMQNNFKPTAATWLLHVSPRAQAAGIGTYLSRFPLWGWLLIVLMTAGLATAIILLRHRKKNQAHELAAAIHKEGPVIVHEAPAAELHEALDGNEDNAELMHRICQLIEEHKLFLNPNLKLTDITTALRSSRTVISNCINSQRDCSFPQFINTYRIAHAQELLRNHPDLKITEVCLASGFSSEASFYRIFKAATGTTPTEWKSSL